MVSSFSYEIDTFVVSIYSRVKGNNRRTRESDCQTPVLILVTTHGIAHVKKK